MRARTYLHTYFRYLRVIKKRLFVGNQPLWRYKRRLCLFENSPPHVGQPVFNGSMHDQQGDADQQ